MRYLAGTIVEVYDIYVYALTICILIRGGDEGVIAYAIMLPTAVEV